MEGEPWKDYLLLLKEDNTSESLFYLGVREHCMTWATWQSFSMQLSETFVFVVPSANEIVLLQEVVSLQTVMQFDSQTMPGMPII